MVLVDRANYGRLKPVMEAIEASKGLELQVIAAGTMVLERFDRTVELVRADGFPVSSEVYMELEGSTPVTMAKSVGFGIVEFSNELQRLHPDFVVIIGDRYEALSASMAAAFMNIPVVHLQGGEVSGSIDESIRHSVTKFAQYHYPATQRAADYLVRMGEDPDTILGKVVNGRGSGIDLDPTDPFLLIVFHPVTTDYGTEYDQMIALLTALDRLSIQSLLLWPNIDAGSDHISKAIRVFRDQGMKEPWLRVLTNLTPDDYLRVLAAAACAIGNSSSFVRDASFFGTPIALVGNRQDGREMTEQVLRVSPIAEQIERAVRAQLDHGRYPPSALYGDGHVAEKFVQRLQELKPYVQKRLAFIEEGEGPSETQDVSQANEFPSAGGL